LIYSTLLPLPLFTAWQGNEEFGVVLSSMLGLLSLSATQISFGILLSYLGPSVITNYLVTVIALTIMQFSHFLADSFASLSIVQDFLNFVSLELNFRPFTEGLVLSTNLSFFILSTLTYTYLGMIWFRSEQRDYK
jgi:hypothetical protein